jgi:hypothetical protein
MTGIVGQRLTENYARLPGVEATDPMMVDGNLKTEGETIRRLTESGNVTPHFEAVVKLPEPKIIHKIVIYSPNIKSFSIWADRGEGWVKIKEVKAVSSNPIVVSLTVRTDKIMINPTAVAKGKEQYPNEERVAIIQEIELY